MVYFQKYNCNDQQIRRLDETFGSKIMKKESRVIKRLKSKLFPLLCLCFLSCSSFIWLSQIFEFPFSFSCIHQRENFSYEELSLDNPPMTSSVSFGTLYCNRSHFRTDICFMEGDIRTNSSSSSIFLYSSTSANSDDFPTISGDHELMKHETIKPYTRKWETSVMNTIDQLHLISKHKPSSESHHRCDVTHDVPAIFFSTGGYTGNVYHEFNDGIIPLYITSQHFNKQVIFVILEYHSWWYSKYAPILAQLSNYPPISFNSISKTHCFQEAIFGLKIHDELTIHPSLSNVSILGFRNLLRQAFEAAPNGLVIHHKMKKPRMVLLSRSGSRGITNEHALVKLAQKIGFDVQILKPNRKMELAKIYKVISSSDVMVGVHGAAMTHFLFLEPNCTLVQVIPLGTEWASETYYGEPARKMGLTYIGYKIHPRESSLYDKYDEDDPILRDPISVNKKGWEFTKKVYLDDQSVRLDLTRVHKLLIQVYNDRRLT